MRRVAPVLWILSGCLLLPAPTQRLSAQAPQRLTVFNAGSLGRPLRDALTAFTALHPEVTPAQENAGSLESARKLTELGKIPDILALADEAVFPALLMPRQVDWYVAFARNEMVLAYTDRSIGAAEINGSNWTQVLQRPGVRIGRSDPALDPNGYRALMVINLEERRAHDPGLAQRLLAVMPPAYIRPKEADLVALVQTGELDYAWSYKSVARAAGLKYVDLPPEVDLSDPGRAAIYGTVSVTIPRSGSPDPANSADNAVVVKGAPILYALSIPKFAEDPTQARAFVTWLLGPAGRDLLTRAGFTVLDHPIAQGHPPAWVRALTR